MMLNISFSTIIVIIGAYGIGSIPFGLIFTKLSGRGDIRNIGSGNIGATNVLRTGSRKLAALTLVFDAGKGAAAVGIANYFADIHIAALAGLFTVIGHCFPVWLTFRGGKGVATSLAVFTALTSGLGGICNYLAGHRFSITLFIIGRLKRCTCRDSWRFCSA